MYTPVPDKNYKGVFHCAVAESENNINSFIKPDYKWIYDNGQFKGTFAMMDLSAILSTSSQNNTIEYLKNSVTS